MEDLYKKYCDCGYRVTTDSRTIKGGEIFFALRGENFDGNEYAVKALEDGAAYAVVNATESAANGRNWTTVPEPIRQRILTVEDPLATLTKLAAYHRNHVKGDCRLPVIGLTGTNGKTTTKELINAVLSRKFRVTATKGNLNNDIGVPLSILSITPETEIAVIEMGANHPDDIAKLVKVSQPDYGLITNVGKAHLLGFGSFEGVKAAKGELYRWLGSQEGSVIFLNEDDADLREMASKQPCHQFGYGLRYQGAEILPVTADEPFVRICVNGRTIRTRLVGAYNATNVMAALCIGNYFGVPADEAVAAIEAYLPSNNRSQMVRSERNTLVVDAYNANPSSMKAALDNFAMFEADCKYAMLGDMRELGAESYTEHYSVIARLVDMIMLKQLTGAFVVGDEFGKALAAFTEKNITLMTVAGACIWHCDSSEALAGYLEKNILSGAAVLIKGSRGIKMENIIPEL